ncbi:PREDICTED: COPII coat assembly protein sec16 isoform X1 [Papilio xuthus]|uniref:glycogenin glucosyltransferase n=1 Tax=Papilio xuthus TaxID=66420 RepID=A0AAJ6ZP10_PAPXU|nr:PREDICTED: COPII coat assembly protein sec16 isoform X1 [Papilio xuthus]
MSNRAWVTLATNDSYGLGALVLAHSLRRAGSAYPAVALITPSVTDAMRERLSAVFAEVVVVDVLDSGDAAHLALLQRPELGITFTKIHCWNLTQYEKCVFLDADTLVVQNCDELFEREELSAAPDVGWPDCFNSGVFVYRPSAETFASLVTFAQERGSFDGGDQGLLNSYFSDWAHGDINKHLPFLYNVTSAAFYSYLPALKHYGQNLKIIHFIGAAKPWLQQFNWQSRSVDAPDHLRELLQQWWDIFVSQVHPLLDTTMVEVEDVPTTLVLPEESIFTFSEPRSEYICYKPTLNPESEFYWHRPEAQIPDTEVIVPPIDMTQFHDPWDIYQGHIREPTDETKSNRSYHQEEEIIRHVWAQPSMQQFQHFTEPHHKQIHDARYHETHHNQSHDYGIHGQEISHVEWHNNQPQHSESHHIEQQHRENIQNYTHHSEHHYTQHVDAWHTRPNAEIREEDNTTQHSWPQPHSTENYNIQDYYENKHYDGHQNDYQSYDKQIESHSNFSYNQQSFHHSVDPKYPNTPTELYQQSYQEYSNSQISDHSQSQSTYHQGATPSCDQNSPSLGYHSMHQHEHSQSHHHENEKDFCNQQERPDSSYTSDQPSHIKDTPESQNIQNHLSHHYEQIDQLSQPIRKRIEYAYYVHLDHEKERIRQIEKLKELVTEKVTNGHGSESEIDDFEDFIIPRHPYDGFYLRHRMTIDSRGRKICTHEIPPTPSPSPSISPPESPVYFDAESELLSPEDTYVDSDDRLHSGVAGNLARVSPGDVGTQREALDELTRRQGWEAGNIDYMGADSFANIWAKISQTLSQPPASAPKEPTPPPVAPQVEATEVSQSEVPPSPAAEEPKAELPVVSDQSQEVPLNADETSKVIEPVGTAPPTGESVPLTTSETAPLAIPEPSLEPAVETVSEASAVVSKSSSQVIETPSEKAEPTSQNLEPVPQEAEPSPVEAVEAPIAKETAPTAEAAIPDAAASEKATIPVETADIPVESSIPETPEIPVPVVEAVLAEKEIPAEETVKIDEIPAPVLEASSVEIAKSESELGAAEEAPKEQKTEEKVVDVTTKVPAEVPAEALPTEKPAAAPETPAATEAPSTPTVTEAVPPKPVDIPLTGATDSPPLANTPSKEDVTADPAAKSEARRKPAGKLRLHPPAVADPLPTPDSELEDADTLAQSIIASELRTPTVTSPSPALRSPVSPPPPKQEKRLSADETQLPTPPVGAVSLSQIGVKPAKEKPTTAAQIESSLADKPAPTSPTSPTEPKAPAEAPKKKVVKKVVKKETAASGDAPVPPPRKKEKKPKEK